jgi:predicted choloylglycine hydrolase
MKRFLKLSLLVLLLVLAGLGIIFQERLIGTLILFRLENQLITALNNGMPALHFQFSGTWQEGEKTSFLMGQLHYEQAHRFLVRVKYEDKDVLIQSQAGETQVQVLPENVQITGLGNHLTNFDLFRMLGEVLENHPKLKKIKELDFSEKLGIAGWALWHCDFEHEEFAGKKYRVARFPKEILTADLALWTGPDGYRIAMQTNSVQIKLEASKVKSDYEIRLPGPEQWQNINVARKELNTAIYRGAARALGILLENQFKPTPEPLPRTWGKGKLIFPDGNRVLLAKGSYRELGEAHGMLLGPEVRKMVDATLYTICWVYTLERKRWFIDDLRGAYQRLEPFIPAKYQEEMLGLSVTSEISLDEIRLTNVFPELFHCSGFALFGDATVDGKLYHGRVLDYFTELGLQHHAVIFVFAPTDANAFVNVGYAGFIGSVTGMNNQQVAFGEMGGRGEDDWDGMPMGFLMREGLERAESLEAALKIFQDTPRTCEYFYVISDGKIPDARGLSTSPRRFEIILPNQWHEMLQTPVKDAVLLSGSGRYEKLVAKVLENYGKIDAEKAIRLMDRPVAMKSNLHNVLFAPQSLELWVANAGGATPACQEPYFHYDLQALLTQMP